MPRWGAACCAPTVDSQKWLSHFMSQLGVFALAEVAFAEGALVLAARSDGGAVISMAQMAAGRMYMEAR